MQTFTGSSFLSRYPKKGGEMKIKGRILVTDDDPPVVATLTGLVERLSYLVFSAGSGEEALEILRSEKIDLLITDIHMPGMGGIELMKRVRELYPDIQIMVITGYGDLKTSVAAMQYGAFNYLQKPFRAEELEIALEQGMEKGRLLRDIAEKQYELEAQNERLRREIRERKKAERERDMQRRQLIQADKLISLGILVTGIAHEINNPNNFIMMNTPMLHKIWKSILPVLDDYYERKGDFDAGGGPYSEMRKNIPFLLNGISEGSERIRRIVQELKEFARTNTENRIEKVDVNRAAVNAVRLSKNLLRKSTNRFITDFDENLPEIQGNFQKLEQVFIHLIRNACQSLRNREESIRISTTFCPKNGEIRVQVTDEGIGISKKDMQRITDPFFTTRRHAGGTGLGLSVSASIVQEHGGKISAESSEGKGSVFTVSLPLEVRKPPVRILVAGDEPLFRELLALSLRKKGGYKVQEAADAAETCILLGRDQPDLLVLNIHMPETDGVKICRKIREDETLADMKVIISTELPDSPETQEIIRMGFPHIYFKKNHLREFLQLVGEILHKEEK